jgi:hypothetical protein
MNRNRENTPIYEKFPVESSTFVAGEGRCNDHRGDPRLSKQDVGRQPRATEVHGPIYEPYRVCACPLASNPSANLSLDAEWTREKGEEDHRSALGRFTGGGGPP